MEITREELTVLIDQRIEERRRNRSLMETVLNEFKEDFEKFDYSEHIEGVRPWNGTTYSNDYEEKRAHAIRAAVSALIRGHYKVKRLDSISPEKADEARKLIKELLEVAMPQ